MNRDTRRALADAAVLGGFFALPTVEESTYTAADVYDAESPALAALVSRVHRRLGGEERVVASVTHLGYVARLVSPMVAVALLSGSILVVPPSALKVGQRADGGLQFGAGTDVSLTELSASALLDCLRAHLDPFATNLRARYRLAPSLLWGNAASALVGAVRVLPLGLRPSGARLAEELLAPPPLAGALRPSLVRRTCCLYYRLPGGGTCGDCPLGRSAIENPVVPPS